MSNKLQRKYDAAEAAGDFPWDLYEDGWNGKSLKPNKKVQTIKSGKNRDKVFCHEANAQDVYNKFSGQVVENKEVKKNTLVKISDISLIDDNTALITINNGANNIIVDLNKETKFFNMFNAGNRTMDKNMFVQHIATPEFKNTIINMDLYAKIGTDKEKASIWDGYVEQFAQEMKNSITTNNKAYNATIISTNKGGFVVEISNIIKAFMPGSMAAANRITDFESYIGKTLEVMVESWDPVIGFVVSRKKYLRIILPHKIKEMEAILKKNRDTVFTGHITGTTEFGVFVEINEFITGMLHKSLVRDETREAMRNGTIETGKEINVYVHKIDGTRVILSDVPSTERDAVMARREAEEIEEKANKNI